VPLRLAHPDQGPADAGAVLRDGLAEHLRTLGGPVAEELLGRLGGRVLPTLEVRLVALVTRARAQAQSVVASGAHCALQTSGARGCCSYPVELHLQKETLQKGEKRKRR
jgi:hypothetical protein